MTEDLYTFFTGAFGLSFLAIGAGFLVEPGRERVRKAFGSLFVALGMIYAMSWLSLYHRLPFFLDNFIVLAVVYTISQSLFEMSIYVFGGESVVGSRRNVYTIGAAWSAALWLLPLLDSLSEAPVTISSIEDGRVMGLFQTLGSAGVYIWPIAITAISFRAGRRHPADLPHGPGVTWVFLGAFVCVIIDLIVVGISLVTSSVTGYRVGHIALQLMMLAWYLYFRSRPDAFRQARVEIELRHEQRKTLDPAEIATIAERLRRAGENDGLLTAAELSLNSLARKLRVPTYKLSAYFNATLGLSFPAWLNAVRIEQVCRLLVEHPERTILDIAMEAGYASKAVFNTQFRRLVGMSPREYREKHL